MTRSSGSPLLPFDPEIERSLHFANRIRRLTFGSADPEHNQESVPEQLDFDCSSSVNFSAENMAAQDNRTLKQLGALSVNNEQPLCIRYPTVNNDAASFELKSGLIHLLPKFHGLAGEDPHKHLKEFHVVCSTMKPQGVTEEQIKLRAFPFSLEGGAKDWLYYLQPSSIETWNEMARLFLEKYFPSSRATTIRKEISGIRQGNGENLYEYWERFKRLCASCPHHQIPDSLLIVYFYEGLLPIDRNLIDAASGGAFSDKTPVQARELIANMAANAQQFGTRANSSAVYQVQGSSSQPSAAFVTPAALDLHCFSIWAVSQSTEVQLTPFLLGRKANKQAYNCYFNHLSRIRSRRCPKLESKFGAATRSTNSGFLSQRLQLVVHPLGSQHHLVNKTSKLADKSGRQEAPIISTHFPHL